MTDGIKVDIHRGAETTIGVSRPSGPWNKDILKCKNPVSRVPGFFYFRAIKPF